MDQMDLDDDSTNSVPITNFKSNKLSHIHKKERAEQVEIIKNSGHDEPGSPFKQEAQRQPNKKVVQ
jgi:hypothetical protein